MVRPAAPKRIRVNPDQVRGRVRTDARRLHDHERVCGVPPRRRRRRGGHRSGVVRVPTIHVHVIRPPPRRASGRLCVPSQ